MKQQIYSLRTFTILSILLLIIIEVSTLFIFSTFFKHHYSNNLTINQIERNIEISELYTDEIVGNIILGQESALNDTLKRLSLSSGNTVFFQQNIDVEGLKTAYSGNNIYYVVHSNSTSPTIAIPVNVLGHNYGYLIAKVTADRSALDGISHLYTAALIVNVLFMLGIMLVIYVAAKRYLFKPLHNLIDDMATHENDGFESSSKFATSRIQLKEIVSLEEYLRRIFHKLRKATTFAAIGQTTAMVAHDVRKPLACMKALLNVIPDIKDDRHAIEKLSADVDRNILQANNMLSEILEYSKYDLDLNIRDIDPQSIIDAAVSDALRGGGNIDVAVDYELHHTKHLHADGNKIVRVLNNIIVNAIDAMKGKGRIWIKTSDYVSNDNGLYFHMIIGNDGPRIPSDIISKLFDPFFSRGKTGGTGLGLAICKRIVDAHHGYINVNQNNPKDTEFEMRLPASATEATINPNELIRHSDELKLFRDEEIIRGNYSDSLNVDEIMKFFKSRGKPLSLLIVDDEPLFRESLRSIINSIVQIKDKIRVIEADSAEIALNLFQEIRFDYVISDIDMGRNRMDGYEMSSVILNNNNDTYLLIHSNKRREEMDKSIRDIRSPRLMGFLPKCMNQSQLLQFFAKKTFEVPESSMSENPVKKKILVVNDDDALLLTLKIQLRAPRTQVLIASDVKSARAIFAHEKPNIIISDINLGTGEANGYDFLKYIRSIDEHIPFYLLSGLSMADEEPKAMAHGANGYIQLPVEKDQLLDIINGTSR